MTDQTLVLIKPDAVEAGVHGRIIDDILGYGYTIERQVTLLASPEQVDAHYSEHLSKDFYPSNRNFMMSGQLIAINLTGIYVQPRVRELIGPTDPRKADLSTLRGYYRQKDSGLPRNLVHASDSTEAAAREIKIWFGEGSL